MYRFFYPDFVRGRGAFGLLALRLVMGTAFILHGWDKVKKPFNWLDGHMPDPPPGILQAAGAFSEVGGGGALILGVLTPLAALLLGAVMIVALGMVHLPAGHPFVSTGGPSYELAAVYLACCLVFLLVGPGIFSLDAWFFRRRHRTWSVT